MATPALAPTSAAAAADAPVRRSITVKAGPERAFRVFTEELDSWWPRTHHIGKEPMRRAVLEAGVGGRCYTEQVDGTECDWGKVLAWEPPHRLVFAWQITPEWGYQPDLARSSEVELRFTPLAGGGTRIDLEHRGFARMGPGGERMREQVTTPSGWGGVLALYAARLDGAA